MIHCMSFCSPQMKHYKQTHSFMIWRGNSLPLWLQTVQDLKCTLTVQHTGKLPDNRLALGRLLTACWDGHIDRQMFTYKAKTRVKQDFATILLLPKHWHLCIEFEFGGCFLLSFSPQTYSTVNSGFNSAPQTAITCFITIFFICVSRRF